MQYDHTNLVSALTTARRLAYSDGRNRYVALVDGQYSIDFAPPSGSDAFYRVLPNGAIVDHDSMGRKMRFDSFTYSPAEYARQEAA